MRLLIDNTTAVAYINRKGGTRSPQLATLGMKIWNTVYPARYGSQHIASSRFNKLRSRLCIPEFQQSHRVDVRSHYLSTNYSILHTGSGPLRDALESPAFPVCSTLFRSGALATDAFLQDWSRWTVFIHPPIVLILRILMQMKQDKATGQLIATHWHGQPWFPNLMEMLVDYPARLPALPATIFLPFATEKVHLLWKTLQLAAWPISGDVSRQLDFQKKCAKLSWHHGGDLHSKDMKDRGKCGRVGVFNSRSVHF